MDNVPFTLTKYAHEESLPTETVPLNIKVNDWCVVEHDGEQKTGEIKCVQSQNYEVSAMLHGDQCW